MRRRPDTGCLPFEKQLYAKVLERMGFQSLLGPEQEAGAITELKQHSPQPKRGGETR